jgi:hypothetical protein
LKNQRITAPNRSNRTIHQGRNIFTPNAKKSIEITK